MPVYVGTKRSLLTLSKGGASWWMSGAALDLDFAGKRAYANNAESTPDALLTYTSPSPKNVFNSSGLLVSSSGQLPYDYDPVTLQPLGLLIEEQRTNLFLYSQNFSNGVWSANGAGSSVTANSFTLGAGNRIIQGFTAFTGTLTLSAWFSPADAGKTLQFHYWENSGVGGANAVAFATKTISASGYVSASVTGTKINIIAFWSPTGGTYTLRPNGGVQLEAGAFPTSYIPTTSAQVTRAADRIRIATSAFGWDYTKGTWVIHAYESRGNSRAVGWGGSDGSIYGLAPSAQGGWWAGMPSVLLTAAGTPASDQKIAGAWDATGRSLVRTGGPVVTDALVMPPDDDNIIEIGNSNGGNVSGISRIKRLTYFPIRKSNSELQALAA